MNEMHVYARSENEYLARVMIIERLLCQADEAKTKEDRDRILQLLEDLCSSWKSEEEQNETEHDVHHSDHG